MAEASKVVVVTGASRGIGAALVAAFRARGDRVVATARSIAPAHEPGLLAIPGDIGDPATGGRVIAAALAAFGRVDTLVNNAGIFIPGRFTDYDDDQYRRMLATNLDGFFHVTRAALAAMERQAQDRNDRRPDRGHIVSVTTTLAELGNARVPAALAALTKGGINAATRSLAIEYAAAGIRVNAVSPGIIKTPMHAAETHAAKAAMHPLGRMGEIADVVAAILYLDSAPFVTGEILHVDGGQSAGR